MEREELLTQVNASIEADGKQLSPSLSEESINGELDDALEDITDDEENNKKVVSRLAKRLLRMDGNIHSNVSKQVSDYKKKHPAKTTKDDDKGGKHEEDEDMPAWAKKLNDRLNAMDERSKARDAAAAKDAVVNDIKKGFKAKFKEANIEVNDYIFRQTLRDLEIPEPEEGGKVNVSDLVKTLEKDYYKNLKEAGLDKKDTDRPRFGNQGGGKGESAADRFFNRKGKKEGWKK